MSIVKFITIILVATLLFVIMWRFEGILNLQGTVFESRKSKPLFEQYTTTVTNTSNTFYVQYKDVLGTAGISGPKYYSMDITVQTDSQKLSALFKMENDKVVNIIRNTMNNIPNIDMSNENGRNQVKSAIKAQLSTIYNTDEIDEIYFEKFYYE